MGKITGETPVLPLQEWRAGDNWFGPPGGSDKPENFRLGVLSQGK